MNMASAHATRAPISASDQSGNVVLEHVLQRRRRERDESIRRTHATIVGAIVAESQREAAAQ